MPFGPENLLFLVSQPRAGSTLLQLMLSGNGKVATTSEPWVSLHPIYGLRATGMLSEYGADLAWSATRDFLSQSKLDEAVYRQGLRTFLLNLYGRAAENLGGEYFLDKTPRYYLILDELAALFPGARFIILARHPGAVFSSVLRTWVHGEFATLRNHYHDLLTAPKALADFSAEHGDCCVLVRYEDLVADPEAELRRICEAISISFSAEMLNYEGRADKGWRFGDPVGVHKSDRANQKSVDAWRRCEGRERGLIAAYLSELGGDLLARLGYTDALTPVPGITAAERDEGLAVWNANRGDGSVLPDDVTLRLRQLESQVRTLREERAWLEKTVLWKITKPFHSMLKRKIRGQREMSRS